MPSVVLEWPASMPTTARGVSISTTSSATRRVFSVFDPFLGPVDFTEDETRVSAVGVVDLTQEPG